MTRNHIVSALCAVSCAIAVGCTSDVEPGETGAGPGADAAPSAERVAGAAAPKNARQALERLFERMDAFGPGSREAYEAELQSFLKAEQPVAALRSMYGGLPATALAARWKTVYVAGEVGTPEALPFLEEIATSAPEIDPSAVGEAAGDRGFRLRYAAAVGAVQAHKKGVVGASATVERLLKQTDAQIAQLIGVELFSAGKLTPALRGLLDERGISTKFERMSDAEHQRVFSVDPETTRPRNDGSRKRPLSESVPSLEDEP
ncbi:MAG TPA: hypothetical protein VF103_16010 [Polyangiaceae bacterium]